MCDLIHCHWLTTISNVIESQANCDLPKTRVNRAIVANTIIVPCFANALTAVCLAHRALSI